MENSSAPLPFLGKGTAEGKKGEAGIVGRKIGLEFFGETGSSLRRRGD